MIDINKKYRYRNGKEARILCVDGGDENYPVIALTREGQTSRHTKSGALCNIEGQHIWDLVEVKEKNVLWLNVYNSPFEGFIYREKECADDESYDEERIARIKVEYEKGQFDE